jgi:chemotaxis protein MotB
MARKRKQHAEGNSERWLLTYCDLITLLCAFFIVMYASSKADLEKFGRLAQGLSRALGGGVVDTGGGEGVLSDNAGIFDFGQLSVAQRTFMQVSERLQTYASKQGLSESIAVNVKSEGIVITLANALLFPSGGIGLSDESRKALDQIAELIRPLPNEIRIEAHTDNLPTDDSLYPTNWELSAARAAIVARYLGETGGIDPKRLSVVGFGEYHPLYANDTREHRAHNRRADIVILYPNEKPAPIVNLLGQGLSQGQKTK